MPDKTAAQEVLASTHAQPGTQVAFNLKKGSLPVRGDVDLAAANDCMKKGLEVLLRATSSPSTDQLITPGHQRRRSTICCRSSSRPSMTPEDAQKRYAEIIASAD